MSSDLFGSLSLKLVKHQYLLPFPRPAPFPPPFLERPVSWVDWDSFVSVPVPCAFVVGEGSCILDDLGCSWLAVDAIIMLLRSDSLSLVVSPWLMPEPIPESSCVSDS